MKKILLIGLCILVAALGFNVASAADVNSSDVSEVFGTEENNMEYISVENNGLSPNFEIRNPGPWLNRDPNPFNNKYNYNIDMVNESNQNHNNNDNNPIVGAANETDIGKLNSSTEPDYKIIDKTETFDYKGDECFLALVDTGNGQKLVCYKASSTGMNAAGSSYVGEVGSEIVQILEEKGIIAKWAYDCSMRQIKKLGIFQKILKEVFDYDFLSCINDDSKEYYIIYVAFGEKRANEYLESNSNK